MRHGKQTELSESMAKMDEAAAVSSREAFSNTDLEKTNATEMEETHKLKKDSDTFCDVGPLPFVALQQPPELRLRPALS